jgi:hypothetical protein
VQPQFLFEIAIRPAPPGRAEQAGGEFAQPGGASFI